MYLLDKVTKHPLCRIKIGDDAVLEWANRNDVARRPADHALRLGADSENRAGILVNSNNAWLIENNAPTADVDQSICSA